MWTAIRTLVVVSRKAPYARTTSLVGGWLWGPLLPTSRPSQPSKKWHLHFLYDGLVYLAKSQHVAPAPGSHVASLLDSGFSHLYIYVLSRISSAAAAVLARGQVQASFRCGGSEEPSRWQRPLCGGRWKPCAMPPRERRVGTSRGRRAGRRCCSPPTRYALALKWKHVSAEGWLLVLMICWSITGLRPVTVEV